MDTLKFGTDGWRDIIGDKFTFSNVARVAQAYANHLLACGGTRVLVGYDTRFNSRHFAERVTEILAANGLSVVLSDQYLPTPALSYAVKKLQASGGVMLTASHNPSAYLGFKLKGAYGGTATDAIYKDVSNRLSDLDVADIKVFDPKRHSYEISSFKTIYYDGLAKLIDLPALESFEGSIVHDAMGGAGSTWLKGFFDYLEIGLNFEEVRGQPDPLFYGVNPEPIPQNLEMLQEHMRQSSAVFAVATDGDADRLGVVLAGGQFFNSHQIFAVLLNWLCHKGLSGDVIKTFTVSRLIELLAKARGLRCHETPVGFKYIVDAMLQEDILIGGEESGGIGVKGHIPERDGLANTLLLLEAISQTGLSIAEMFAGLEHELNWQHHYDRVDLKLESNTQKKLVLDYFATQPKQFANRLINSIEKRDGIKLNLDGQAWLLFRASGTEPLLRIYCEAQSEAEMLEILEAAQLFVKQAETTSNLLATV